METMVKMNNITINENKDFFWQEIRGICIICVILIHCANGASYSELNSLNSWNFDYWIIMRQVINFPVAIFIFLSGYFTKIESVENSYVRNRIKRLLIPFLVWSTFYTLLNLVFSSSDVNVFEIIVRVILGLSSGQLYFILVLLQLMFITPYLVKVIKNKRNANLLFLITPLYLLCVYLYAVYFKEQFPFYQTMFPAWFAFYYAGLWVRIKQTYEPIDINKKQIVNSLLCCVLCLVLSILEAYVLLAAGFSNGFASSQIKTSCFLYAFSIINLFLVLKPYASKFENRVLIWIGDNSYGIYFIHTFWIMLSAKILSHVAPLENVLLFYQVLQLIIVLAMSCVSIIIVKRIIGNRLSRKFFGF